MSAAHHSYSTTETEDWDRSMGVVVVPLTPPRSNTSLPGELGGPRQRLVEVMKLHCSGNMVNMSDDEEECLSVALGDWINANSSPYEN